MLRAALHRRRDARGGGAVSRLPGVDPRAHGASRERRRTRGDARVPGCAALRLRVRRRLERRRRARRRARAARGRARRGRDATRLDGYDVIVDALFGTGFHGEPRPDAADLIERINAAPAPVVSVDLPSGVDASTGEIAGAAVDADLTVTFHAPKVGLVVAPGRFHAGRGRRRRHRARGRRRRSVDERLPALLDLVPRRGARGHEVQRPAPFSSSAARAG